MSIHCTCHACKKSGEGKSKHLVEGNVYPACRSGNVILANGLYRTAEAGTDKHIHDRYADDGYPEAPIEIGQLRNAAHGPAASGDLEVTEGNADDLSKGNCDNGQIISF